MTNFRKQHQELARLATNAAKRRGHELGTWSWTRPGGVRVLGHALCLECGMSAAIDTWPEPPGIDVSGEALTVSCRSDSPRCTQPIDAAIVAPCEREHDHDGPCRAWSLETTNHEGTL